MMAIVMVFLSAMTASSMPDDLRALDEGIHYDIERRRLDAGDEARLVDAALPQREAVGEHPHAGAGQPRQIVRAGARPCREHAVLDEEQGHLVLCRGKLLRKVTTEAHVVRVERVARFDQKVSWHRHLPSWRDGRLAASR